MCVSGHGHCYYSATLDILVELARKTPPRARYLHAFCAAIFDFIILEVFHHTRGTLAASVLGQGTPILPALSQLLLCRSRHIT